MNLLLHSLTAAAVLLQTVFSGICLCAHDHGDSGHETWAVSHRAIGHESARFAHEQEHEGDMLHGIVSLSQLGEVAVASLPPEPCDCCQHREQPLFRSFSAWQPDQLQVAFTTLSIAQEGAKVFAIQELWPTFLLRADYSPEVGVRAHLLNSVLQI